MKNVYLIGMMGCGKTETGRNVARELALGFVDLDHEIEKRVGMSINEIFESRGEPYFRQVEKAVLKETSQRTNQVVATGGGVVLDTENVRMMKERGFTIFLSAALETLWSRIGTKTDRPLLKVPNPRETFVKIFQDRLPLYKAAANHTVVTEGKDAREITKEIVECLGSSKPS